MAYFVGIDGGGSQTTCVVGDEQHILGRAQGGTSKLARAGEKQSKRTLLALLHDACRNAGTTPEQLDSVCIGMSGADNPQIAQTIRKLLGSSLRASIEVVGDIVVALEAAVGDGAGLIVIAGTGSAAYGRNQQGETARAGGWGPEISDEGSGVWIGQRAVADALRAHDAGNDSALLCAILSAWSFNGITDLVASVNQQSAPDYAQLLPVVLKLAEGGDASATSILNDAGIELANLALVVLRRLWNDGDAVNIRMCGGVFRHSAVTRRSFAKTLHAEFAFAEISDKIVEPVLGALYLARKASISAAKQV